MRRKDLTGEKFGFLTALARTDSKLIGNIHVSMWLCRCECRTEKIIRQSCLISGNTKSCGCLQDKSRRTKRNKLHPGDRFGNLIVIAEIEPRIRSNGADRRMVRCKCDCGVEKVINQSCLVTGGTKSCGCLRKRSVYKTHGMTNTKTYRAWEDIKKRCYQKNNKRYSTYGARGIKVCDRWVNSFENFLEDMGEAQPGMSIERIDNNKDYSPGNCKWIPRTQQSKNRTNSVWIEFKGKKMILADWARELGIHETALRNRIRKLGSVDVAFSIPKIKNGMVRNCMKYI